MVLTHTVHCQPLYCTIFMWSIDLYFRTHLNNQNRKVLGSANHNEWKLKTKKSIGGQQGLGRDLSRAAWCLWCIFRKCIARSRCKVRVRILTKAPDDDTTIHGYRISRISRLCHIPRCKATAKSWRFHGVSRKECSLFFLPYSFIHFVIASMQFVWHWPILGASLGASASNGKCKSTGFATFWLKEHDRIW